MLRHRLPALSLLIAACGCGLPGIPADGGEPDAGVGGDAEPVADGADGMVCRPGSRICQSPFLLQVCAPDGTDWRVESCPTTSACSDGGCVPYTNVCDGALPFRLSTSALLFDTERGGKNQTLDLELVNCGERSLRVASARVTGPTHEDGRPVYAFHPTAPRKDFQLMPGSRLPMKILYRSTGEWVEEAGQINLSVIADEAYGLTVSLASRSPCLSASPTVDFGLRPLHDAGSADLLVLNCGNVPMRIERIVRSTGVDGRTLSAQELDWEPGRLPLELAPGAVERLSLSLVRPRIGPFRETLFVRSVEADTGAPVSPHAFVDVHGVVARVEEDAPCRRDLMPPVPRVVPLESDAPLEGAIPRTRPLRGVLLVPPAGQEVPPGMQVVYELLAPSADEEPWSKLSRPAPVRESVASMFPDVARRYRVGARLLDEQGQPSCAVRELAIDALPAEGGAGYYAELHWESDGDLITGDEGPGRGVDLDLVARWQPRGQGEEGSWREAASSCWPQRVGALGPCADGQGTALLASRAGPSAGGASGRGAAAGGTRELRRLCPGQLRPRASSGTLPTLARW